MQLDETFVLQSEASADGDGTPYRSSFVDTLLTITVTGWFGATVNFEMSTDNGDTWFPVVMYNVSTGDRTATSTTVEGVFQVPAPYLGLFRATITGFTFGSVTVTGRAQANNFLVSGGGAGGGTDLLGRAGYVGYGSNSEVNGVITVTLQAYEIDGTTPMLSATVDVEVLVSDSQSVNEPSNEATLGIGAHGTMLTGGGTARATYRTDANGQVDVVINEVVNGDRWLWTKLGGNTEVLVAALSPVHQLTFAHAGVSSIENANLQLWFSAASMNLNNNDLVGTWPDLSGHARDATQATGSKKPQFKTNVLNGLPGVHFDGVDDFLGGTLGGWTTGDEELTVFALARYWDGVSDGEGGAIIGASEATSNRYLMMLTSGVFLGRWGGTTGQVAYAWTEDTSFHSWVETKPATGINPAKLYKDSALVYTAGPLPANAIAPTLFKLGILSDSSSFPGKIDLLELAMWNKVLTAGDLSQLASYVSARYGI